MEKIFIEDYKGHSIYYSEDSDKFHCDIELNGNVKSSKRGSLKDLRKEIDLFIKENLNFKPFDFYEKESWSVDVKKMTCTGIRSDGRFIINNGHNNSYVGIEYFSKTLEYDSITQSKLELMETELELYRKEYRKKKAELTSQLKPLDISKYGSIFYKTGE